MAYTFLAAIPTEWIAFEGSSYAAHIYLIFSIIHTQGPAYHR